MASINNLHQYLENKLDWYKTIHEHKYHKIAHYCILIISIAFFIGLIVSSSPVKAATTYYIDPSGNDTTGNGTSTPWKTLYKACSTVSGAGDIIHVNAGTYTETQTCILAVGVSIEGDGITSIIHSNVTEGGGRYKSTIEAISPEGTNGNQHISFLKLDGNNLTADWAIHFGGRSNVSIHDTTIVDFFNFGVTMAGRNDGQAIAPTIYATGNTFYNNTIDNCAWYDGWGRGDLNIGGQEGMLIHDNNLKQDSRPSGQNGWPIKYTNDGYLKGLKIYNNIGVNGGGVWVQGPATFNVTGCNITANTSTNPAAAAGGGGISVVAIGASAINTTIKNSTISYNTVASTSANNGGGISVQCGANAATAVDHKLWIENSTIYGNSTGYVGKVGAGICFKTTTFIDVTTPPTQTVTLNHCTIANNTTNGGTGADGVCFDVVGGYATKLVMNNSIVMGNSGSTSNASQVGVNSFFQYNVEDGGIANSILGISGNLDTQWVFATPMNNKLDAVVANLAFESSLSSDATPVLKIGATSIARDFVATNYLSPVLDKDQLGISKVGNRDAGAYEYHVPSAVQSISIYDPIVSALNGKILVSNINEFSSIRVFDAVGRMIVTKEANNGSTEIQISKSGIYAVQIESASKSWTKKLVLNVN